MRIFEGLISLFSKTKKGKPASLENLEALKIEFLEMNSRLSSTVFSPDEKKEANAKLHSLAMEIAPIFGGADWIYILAKSLECGISEPSAQLKEFLKRGDMPTLIREFKDVHFAMMLALNESFQENLNIRLKHVAAEIADRLGGPEFFWTLNTALQKNKTV